MDDRLRLIFTCCHPALPLEARVALTLRVICAVPTADIARAFLVRESTMTRRITRAKAKIADAGIPYGVPGGPALTERLPGVLAVLYLLFTHGYNADGEPAFADEAIRLARLLSQLMPDQPEPAALLALCLLQHSRRAARRDAGGALVTLGDQDRSRWDRAAIDEALGLLGARSTTPGRTRCRRRSRPATRPRPRPPTPTGTGSRTATTRSPGSRPARSSSSTGPSPTATRTGRRPASRCSRRRAPAARSTTTRSPSPPRRS